MDGKTFPPRKNIRLSSHKVIRYFQSLHFPQSAIGIREFLQFNNTVSFFWKRIFEEKMFKEKETQEKTKDDCDKYIMEDGCVL